MREPSQFRLLLERRFAPFFGVQFLGALNDNLFKQALVILLAYQTASFTTMSTDVLQNLAQETENLRVRIFSFSYRRDLPRDDAGHGGGFVFDCRGLPNPGREERFRSLTGRDVAVIDYLNQEESVHQFLANTMSLVDASISAYQNRGFKNLMVSFGCTATCFTFPTLSSRLKPSPAFFMNFYRNYNWGLGPQDDNGYYLNRFIGHADFHFGRQMRVFFELKSGVVAGRNGGPRPSQDEDKLDLKSAFSRPQFPLPGWRPSADLAHWTPGTQLWRRLTGIHSGTQRPGRIRRDQVDPAAHRLAD